MTAAPQPEPVVFSAATTRGSARLAMVRAFTLAGLDSPDLDARLLLCGVAPIDPTDLILRPDVALGPSHRAVTAAANRRLNHEPVSRILGRRAFYGRDFEIGPATLDPRPDSETLIDAALAAVAYEGWRQRRLNILDIGTGSGCLLVTLLAALPNAIGLGTDVSPAALETARRNAERLGVAGRTTWKITDGLSGIDGPFDLIVANPPYIPSASIAHLQRDVRDHDPHLALDGGVDGLAVYRAIIKDIHLVLPNGYAFFEVGADQSAAVAGLLEQQQYQRGWPAPVISLDLGGVARCVAQKTLR